MSAIAGICAFDDQADLPELGRRMMSSLAQYPADSAQSWHRGGVFLGCRAQWITPESVGEQLPYYDERRGIAITADAILDNRDELFERLQIHPSLRRTMTDSALILLAYEKWGEDAPKHLIGDFAFVIWDERQRRLFGARDFSGARTLYYYHQPRKLAFCTVLEPLLALPDADKSLNEQWIAEFLALMGTTDAIDPRMTVYREIRQLPPSHSMTVAEGKITLRKYCTVEAGETLRLKSDRDYEEAFKDVFGKAVRARLRSRWKVGAQLSGGMDSGTVAGFAARMLQEEGSRLHTFSYVPVDGFEDWTPKRRFANERPYIESSAKHIGNIETHIHSFPEKNPFTEMDEWLDIMEMPYKFFENSYWTKGIYEEAHKMQVGVLLTGKRGNWTISWGNALDYQALLLKQMKWFKFYREMSQYCRNIGAQKSRVIKSASRKAFPALLRLSSSAGQTSYPLLINPDFAQKMNVFDKLAEHGFHITDFSTVSGRQSREHHFRELAIWGLTGTITTRLSLRYRLWDRDPTNDLNVVRFCLSLPEEQYVRNGVDRWLIRRAAKNLLPDMVRMNLRTRGIQGADGVFRMKADWNDFRSEANDLLADPAVSPYLNIEQLKASLACIGDTPKPEYAYHSDFRMLMRGIIFRRFLKNVINQQFSRLKAFDSRTGR